MRINPVPVLEVTCTCKGEADESTSLQWRGPVSPHRMHGGPDDALTQPSHDAKNNEEDVTGASSKRHEESSNCTDKHEPAENMFSTKLCSKVAAWHLSHHVAPEESA